MRTAYDDPAAIWELESEYDQTMVLSHWTVNEKDNLRGFVAKGHLNLAQVVVQPMLIFKHDVVAEGNAPSSDAYVCLFSSPNPPAIKNLHTQNGVFTHQKDAEGEWELHFVPTETIENLKEHCGL